MVLYQVSLIRISIMWGQWRHEIQCSDKVCSRKTIFRDFKLKMSQTNIYFIGLQEEMS